MRPTIAAAGVAAAGVLSILTSASPAAAQARAGGEFLVNSYTTGIQRYGVVAASPDGSFVIAWNSDQQDGSGAAAW